MPQTRLIPSLIYSAIARPRPAPGSAFCLQPLAGGRLSNAYKKKCQCIVIPSGARDLLFAEATEDYAKCCAPKNKKPRNRSGVAHTSLRCIVYHISPSCQVKSALPAKIISTSWSAAPWRCFYHSTVSSQTPIHPSAYPVLCFPVPSSL